MVKSQLNPDGPDSQGRTSEYRENWEAAMGNVFANDIFTVGLHYLQYYGYLFSFRGHQFTGGCWGLNRVADIDRSCGCGLDRRRWRRWLGACGTRRRGREDATAVSFFQQSDEILRAAGIEEYDPAVCSFWALSLARLGRLAEALTLSATAVARVQAKAGGVYIFDIF